MIRVTARHEQSGSTYDLIDVSGAFVIFGRGDDRLALPIGILSAYDYFKHNVRCGDVLRDKHTGELWTVASIWVKDKRQHTLLLARPDGKQQTINTIGLVDYTRVGRNATWRLRK